MNPVKQCNLCANHSCHEKMYKDPIMGFIHCHSFKPNKPFKQRLIKCAIYHEMIERGEVIHAGQLRNNFIRPKAS